MDPRKLSDVVEGYSVTIKTDSGELTEGTVEKILTKVHIHQLGIKVILETGISGRVQKIHPVVSEREKTLNLINEFHSNIGLVLNNLYLLTQNQPKLYRMQNLGFCSEIRLC